MELIIYMRKYQPIWEQIKKDKKASLAADPRLHTRIIKAVRKEKTKDAGWRLLQLEDGFKYKLLDKVDGKLVTFILIDISPIALESL